MNRHMFKNQNVNGMCLEEGCGKPVLDRIHTAFDAPPFLNPMDSLLQEFPIILQAVLAQKEMEQMKSDITRLASALISAKIESPTLAIDTAAYLYERIEAIVKTWKDK